MLMSMRHLKLLYNRLMELRGLSLPHFSKRLKAIHFDYVFDLLGLKRL